MKKEEIYIQDEISSCGAVSIQSILTHYGGYVSLETILEDTNTDKSGTSAFALVRALKKYGFEAYGIKTSLDKLDVKKLPVIAHVNKNGYEHFLVIYDINSKFILTMDPEVGKKKYSRNEFLNIFDQYIITATPNGEIPKYKKSSSLIKFFIPFIKKIKKEIMFVIIMSVIVILLNLILSFHLKTLELNFDPYKTTFIFIIIRIFNNILTVIKERKFVFILKYMDENTTLSFIRHIFKLPLRYLNNKRVGEIVKKLENMSFIKDLFMRICILNSLDVITILVAIVLLFYISYKLTLVNIVVVIIYILITVFTRSKIYKNEVKDLDNYNNYSGTLVEFISGIESIKNLNEEDKYIDGLSEIFKRYTCKHAKKENYNISINMLKTLFYETGILLVNLVGFLTINQSFTIYDLITYETIFNLCFGSIESILCTYLYFLKGKAIFHNTCEFHDIMEERDGLDFLSNLENINIKNLKFTYNFYKDTLNDFSCIIKHGDKILLKGPSGIGKSTFVKILSGRLDNYDGQIFLNNTNLKDISMKSIRDNIIYIGQEEKLFTKTIRENITSLNVDQSELLDVAKITYLDEIVDKRVNGYDTELLEGASNISGGEKARIILARALIKKPKVLIIDELLSSLSENMENQILNNILEIDDLILIYITHRNKDNIFEKIIEFRKDGTYDFKR